ncbi:hypothetical protein COO60DRAFT_1544446 [Scenedesmus sp. NREL 46B-D3]|nr:hypothetical protein COO60DRAFT_1544446 [Scenedesmus sp. NREL 46B-D3]
MAGRPVSGLTEASSAASSSMVPAVPPPVMSSPPAAKSAVIARQDPALPPHLQCRQSCPPRSGQTHRPGCRGRHQHLRLRLRVSLRPCRPVHQACRGGARGRWPAGPAPHHPQPCLLGRSCCWCLPRRRGGDCGWLSSLRQRRHRWRSRLGWCWGMRGWRSRCRLGSEQHRGSRDSSGSDNEDCCCSSTCLLKLPLHKLCGCGAKQLLCLMHMVLMRWMC